MKMKSGKARATPHQLPDCASLHPGYWLAIAVMYKALEAA